MGQLPPVVHVPAHPVGGRDVAAIVELLAMEVGARRPGSRAAAARLSDALLIAAIRRWLDRLADGEVPSWLRPARPGAGAGHRRAIRAAGRAVDGRVARARGPRLPRDARRFAEVVGEPPLTYLTRWRMHLAAQRLKYSAETVGAIAREVGYTSEYAFSRA
jgi:AraC-like DNA-binding protein